MIDAPSRRQHAAARNPLDVAAWVSLWLATAANWPLWRALLELPSAAGARGLLFMLVFMVVLAAMNMALLSLGAWRHILKPLASLLLLVAAAGAYFMGAYRTVIDPTMMVSVLHTRRCATCWACPCCWHLALLAGLPLWLLWRTPLQRTQWNGTGAAQRCRGDAVAVARRWAGGDRFCRPVVDDAQPRVAALHGQPGEFLPCAGPAGLGPARPTHEATRAHRRRPASGGPPGRCQGAVDGVGDGRNRARRELLAQRLCAHHRPRHGTARRHQIHTHQCVRHERGRVAGVPVLAPRPRGFRCARHGTGKPARPAAPGRAGGAVARQPAGLQGPVLARAERDGRRRAPRQLACPGLVQRRRMFRRSTAHWPGQAHCRHASRAASARRGAGAAHDGQPRTA